MIAVILLFAKVKTEVLAVDFQPGGVKNANPRSRKAPSHHFLSQPNNECVLIKF